MNENPVRKAIEDALLKEEYEPESLRRDIAFHLTDWLSDLDSWSAFCADPDSLSSEEIVELLTRFLIHVPNHVAAASKLMLEIPVTDIFGVGATESGGDSQIDD